MSKVKRYFETHAHSHAYHNDPRIYDAVCGLIQSSNVKVKRFLDVGCGDGAFIKRTVSLSGDSEFIGTDVSYQMIKTAQKNLEGVKSNLIVCDAFNLPIRSENKFDFIHIDSVLHHLIGRTKNRSLGLVRELVRILGQKLSDQGILIIEEVYYDSHIVPSLTSTLIFYSLKLFNLLNLDISSFVKEFQLGLEVNFMHTAQIKNILENLHGKVIIVNKVKWGLRPLHRLLLLKEHGHITFTYQKY